MDRGFTVVFQPYGKRIIVKAGENLLKAAREAGVGIRSICGGKGLCGKCKVIVRRGSVRSEDGQKELISEADRSRGAVLACMSYPASD